MKSILLIVLSFLIQDVVSSQVLKATAVKMSFFSEAPFEDIYAESSQGVSAIDVDSRSVYFKVLIQSFQFEKKLMQEHFNENYLESEKYPYAEFKGNIEEPIELRLSGTYWVHVSGELTIHKVTRIYRVLGKIVVKEDTLTTSSEFQVKVADHEVKIPRLLVKNIAEIVLVKVAASYPLSTVLEGQNSASH